jgi:putative sigma-54 modulation protein
LTSPPLDECEITSPSSGAIDSFRLGRSFRSRGVSNSLFSGMQIHLSPRHLTLTAAIYGYVADKINHLEQLTDRILAAHVVLLHDETKTKKHIIKVHLAVPGPDIYAEHAENDLYAAIDKVTGKLSQQLRKRKTRIADRKKHRSRLASEEKKRGFKRR